MTLTFFVFPTTCLQTPFNVDLLIFLEVRFADLGEIAPGHDVEPFVFLAALAFGAGPTAAGDNTETGYWTPARGITHFWVTAQVANYHYLVQTPAHNTTP